MNEIEVNATVQALISQRDANANTVVSLIGKIAVLEDELKKLKEASNDNLAKHN